VSSDPRYGTEVEQGERLARASISVERVLRLLEAQEETASAREAAWTGPPHASGPSRRARLYEMCCLRIQATLADEGLIDGRLFSDDITQNTRQPRRELDTWTEIWLHALWRSRDDLEMLTAERRRLGRWLSPSTKKEAERRAQERFELLVATQTNAVRAEATRRYGRFAGGRFADRVASMREEPAAADDRPSGGRDVPVQLRRPLIAIALVVALIGSAVLLVGQIRSSDRQGPATPSFFGAGGGDRNGSGSAADEPSRRHDGKSSPAAAPRHSSAPGREPAHDKTEPAPSGAGAPASSDSPDSGAAPAEPASEPAAATPEARPSSSSASVGTAPAPSPAPAEPAPTPEQASRAEPSGGGGAAECFTFEC
jgi:hypothetical protein